MSSIDILGALEKLIQSFTLGNSRPSHLYLSFHSWTQIYDAMWEVLGMPWAVKSAEPNLYWRGTLICYYEEGEKE